MTYVPCQLHSFQHPRACSSISSIFTFMCLTAQVGENRRRTQKLSLNLRNPNQRSFIFRYHNQQTPYSVSLCHHSFPFLSFSKENPRGFLTPGHISLGKTLCSLSSTLHLATKPLPVPSRNSWGVIPFTFFASQLSSILSPSGPVLVKESVYNPVGSFPWGNRKNGPSLTHQPPIPSF